MTTTIAVTPEGKKWKVLVNYIQRGVSYSTAIMANHEATAISEVEHCDHLILAKDNA